MLFFDREQVYEKLTPGPCIAAMRTVLAELETGTARQYLRTVTPLPKNIMGYMPGVLGPYFGAKLISVFPTNGGTKYPSHQGGVLLFDAKYGSLLAMADGDAVTGIRTGAVSAVATDLLARKDAHILCLLGAGEQARSHLAALREVRPIDEVRVWDLSFDRAVAFAEKYGRLYGLPCTPFAQARPAVEGAHIICTVTPSKTPVLESEWVSPGAHINAVGACAAADRELPSSLVARGRLYCDAFDSILAESGDFLIPKAEGLFGDDHIVGSIGQVLTGAAPARGTENEITIFEALGLAVEDLASARLLYERAGGLLPE